MNFLSNVKTELKFNMSDTAYDVTSRVESWVTVGTDLWAYLPDGRCINMHHVKQVTDIEKYYAEKNRQESIRNAQHSARRNDGS